MIRHLMSLAAIFPLVCAAAWAEDAASLRLVPFPKEVRLESGGFALDRSLVLQTPGGADSVLMQQVVAELKRAGFGAPAVKPGAELRVRLLAAGDAPPADGSFRPQATPEDYWLRVDRQAIDIGARGPAGLFHGVQTLCQLIRANRRGQQLPCLTIRDWPAMRWRCFQNDMTRGPSAKLSTLEEQVALGAALKMNLFTYYMEYQYAFQKHPDIGPPDGSLQPDELRRLVALGRPLAVEILGNQQSFGHCGRILKLPQFAALRETDHVLTPVKEETYRLLDDFYSEVCPLLPLDFFNVCCDETFGLGTGPSKELAAQIGEGGVYVRHLRRVHDLLQSKYHKRMMMWGDIILKHPEHLSEIPKDTIMLTWGYGNAPSFERQIVPFAQSGFEFFVCPGTSDWSRILPDFEVATVNIRNFVRDGAKHGALGMLNTEWKDDGESLNAPNWHAYAWGAECAWNASATTTADFHRRLGAVLFGEQGDHFGQAIELLGQTHRLSGMYQMHNKRFWENDFLFPRSPAATQACAARVLALVRPAIEHLAACLQEATVNQALLEPFLFGARRMELIAQRGLDAVQAAKLYASASDGPPQEALPLLDKIQSLVRRNRDAHEALGRQFAQLWLEENKPYALDWTTKRYDALVAWYDGLLGRLSEARGKAAAGKPLPSPEEIGLSATGGFARRTRPHAVAADALQPDAAWLIPSATHRLGLTIQAGAAERVELPVELDLRLPAELTKRPVAAFCTIGNANREPIAAQLDPSEMPGTTRLTLLVPGPIARQATAVVHVYLGLAETPKPPPDAASTRDADRGMKWIENDQVRLLLGPEGGHLYRWEVKALGGRDLTMPGETGWAGFSDIGNGHRDTPHKLLCTARGPALVRYQCEDPTGLVKTVSLLAGASWVEVTLNDPVDRYWEFDNPKNFAADGHTPGKYLFSDGTSGAVGRTADGVGAQVKVRNAFWSIKSNREGLALGILTPDVAALHVVGPGGGAGGVGIENSPRAASHFVTYAGLLKAEPRQRMQQLQAATRYATPPIITAYRLQPR